MDRHVQARGYKSVEDLIRSFGAFRGEADSEPPFDTESWTKYTEQHPNAASIAPDFVELAGRVNHALGRLYMFMGEFFRAELHDRLAVLASYTFADGAGIRSGAAARPPKEALKRTLTAIDILKPMQDAGGYFEITDGTHAVPILRVWFDAESDTAYWPTYIRHHHDSIVLNWRQHLTYWYGDLLQESPQLPAHIEARLRGYNIIIYTYPEHYRALIPVIVPMYNSAVDSHGGCEWTGAGRIYRASSQHGGHADLRRGRFFGQGGGARQVVPGIGAPGHERVVSLLGAKRTM
jgi:hypothetical protein